MSHSPLSAYGWYWEAKCAEKLNKSPESIRESLKKVYENYPQSALAAEAYFHCYAYHEYLQGDRQAIKHLERMKNKYPDSPYLMHTFYLIGLDHKRDRRSPEGKWLRRKDLIAAIDAFHDAESTFDELKNKGCMEDLPAYTLLRHHCTLERALANLAIAEESTEAKAVIYLDYAEDVFKQLVDDLDHSAQAAKNEHVWRLLEESSFWLGKTYIKLNEGVAAKEVFAKMLDSYRQAKITKGYFLSRVWYELGVLAIKAGNFQEALAALLQGEDSSSGRILTADQKLDLWIQQSQCYRELNQMEHAMLTLSKAINSDEVSALRLKAMYLRAEIYEIQKRYELAKKQLEAAANKGGEWALKAKIKLEQDYGFQ